ncbi:TonB system transport protein ExbD [Malaciobacter canalis]|uniref:Biopolymer transport protein ExbD n=1 Tax=Malaciobacter canalis TaxID=1912871 RepID=A0ABX4LSK4_9BACT|nr:TonB system transport protein ExbD [Malaciobacter canalis]PHO10950.1 TonB system transport protein ExbD [Malaciobacter canalis]QEE33025.1 TonB system transport protein ExbD [Malaciobacter canalis]
MKLKKFDGINVLPFIDVLLVLLTIVLMTSTFITKGLIPVSLPSAKSTNNLKIDKKLIIIINNKGEFFCNNNLVNSKNMKNHILKFKKDTQVYIKSDKNARFDSFVQVLDILKSNDFQNISIVTKK